MTSCFLLNFSAQTQTCLLQSLLQYRYLTSMPLKQLPFLCIIIFVFVACGVFETREAEPPDQGGSALFQQPDRPEVVILNLQNAIQNMNTVNYMRSINEESFEFTPSSLASDSNPDVWVNWSSEDENIYFNNMRAATQNLSGHSLQVQNQERTTLPDGDERITADYVLTVNHNRPPQVLPSVAQGRFLMDMTQGDDGLWSISGWTDESAGSEITWSDFKAVFIRE